MRRNKADDAAYRVRYNEENREKVNAYHREWRAKRMAWCRSQLGDSCIQCGSIDRLEIDHIDASTKTFEIGRGLCKPLAVIQSELRKCQLLCFACHQHKTKTLDLPVAKHGSPRMYNHHKCRCEQCRQWKRDYDCNWRASKMSSSCG